MPTNKYPAKCATCQKQVPAHGGTLSKVGRRWMVRHIACDSQPTSMRTRFYGGNGPGTHVDVFQNYNGRCEDAPCCGCCS